MRKMYLKMYVIIERIMSFLLQEIIHLNIAIIIS